MNNRTVKFAVVADPHLDIMHDGEKRIDAFLRAARKNDVDFIIHLGDFIYPNNTTRSWCPIDKMPINAYNAHVTPTDVDKEAVVRIFNSFPKPSYHVLGNHEHDFASAEDMVKIYGMPAPYYAFHINGWHFIVLDANYFKDEKGELVHYAYGQYFLTRDLPYLPSEQLNWLREELLNTNEPVIIFSHQPLFDCPGGIKNLPEFENVINEAKKNGKEIRICINGHLHIDDLDDIDGTLYYNVNCMSNMWVGSRCEPQKRFSDEIEEKYPSLKYVIPYKDSLFAIVTLDDEKISVKGRKTKYVQPGPRKIGFKGAISSQIKSWEKKWSR